MQIVQKENKQIAVLSLIGDPLGEQDAQLLRSRISQVIEQEIKHVVLDLTGVKHINSAGLGGLISAMCAMLRIGGAVFFASATMNVQGAFRITHLDQVFNIYPSVEKAIGDFS